MSWFVRVLDRSQWWAWLGAALLLASRPHTTQAQEFRAYWVDAFHPGFRSAGEVNALTNALRSGNFNAVVVEIRKRGDAYYTPNTAYADYEPHATDTSPAAFDSLADLIGKCHNTSYGQRIEVHAWLVTFPIWNNRTNFPPSAQHPYNRHPEWLMKDNTGATWDGSNYMLDPGHPGVQRHTFTVAMNLVTNYDLDGLNFDYVRYPGNTWGYNSSSVSRFRARFGGAGNPAYNDSAWLQFRRDQVTSLVRRVYLHTMAIKPWVKVSADTICWAPGVTTDAQWPSSAAYSSVLQDWRAWMEEGILDINMPMMYLDHAANGAAWSNWSLFAKDHRYNRHLVIGPGVYLNSVSNAMVQMRSTRSQTPSGNRADGLVLYSYAVPNDEGVPPATFQAALTTNSASVYDSQSPGIFNQLANLPLMPWKTHPTLGHLKGIVYAGSTANLLDGATVSLTSPLGRTQVSDATGFYGFVDLAPGVWTVTATMPGLGTVTNTATVTAGAVSTLDLNVPLNDNTPPALSNILVASLTDHSATVSWRTSEPADGVVEYGPTSAYVYAITNNTLSLTHDFTLTGLDAGMTYHFRVRSADASGNRATSGDLFFFTNPQGVVSDIILDDAQATQVGAWTPSSTSPGYYGTGYRYKSSGSGAAYIEFRPDILTAGNYRVYAWYVQGGNRAPDAPHVISYSGGSQTLLVNQQVDGSQWVLLGTYSFAAGTGGYVRVTDSISSGVVMADAIKFVYAPPPPVAPSVATHPLSLTRYVAQDAPFSVVANGSVPMSFQWRFEGGAIPGATNSFYTRTNLTLGDAGAYSVAITNAGGGLVSSNAWLTVVEPVIPRLANVWFSSGSGFRLGITGEPGAYTVEASSNLVAWLEWTNFVATNLPVQVVDPSTNLPMRYYRARWKP
jgi:uncharacterized lipoprotein YddW (UPF0748 family)